jgi:hypothetical protein
MHDVENLSIPLAGGARGETSGLDPHSLSRYGPDLDCDRYTMKSQHMAVALRLIAFGPAPR